MSHEVTKWLHITFGERNVIERFLRTLEERTRRFYNNLPFDGLDNLETFLSLFMTWYNHLRKHQGLGRTPLGGGVIVTVSLAVA